MILVLALGSVAKGAGISISVLNLMNLLLTLGGVGEGTGISISVLTN